jgi:hypothetical protein
MPYVDGYVVPVPEKNLQPMRASLGWSEKFGEITALSRFGSASR